MNTDKPRHLVRLLLVFTALACSGPASEVGMGARRRLLPQDSFGFPERDRKLKLSRALYLLEMKLRAMPPLPKLFLNFLLPLLLAACTSAPERMPESEPVSPDPVPSALPSEPVAQTTRTIYLAEGGASHLVLVERAPGEFIAEGTLLSHTPQTTWSAELRQTTDTPWLIIRSMAPYRSAPDSGRSLRQFVVVPDPLNQRDWNVAQTDLEVLWEPGSFSRMQVPVRLPDDPTVPFLHRIDEIRIPWYFQLARDADFPGIEGHESAAAATNAELLRLAREMVADHPNDLHVRVLLLDALLRAGQLESLAAEVERGETQAAGVTDPAVSQMFREARRQVEARRLNTAGRNAAEHLYRFLDPQAKPGERIRLGAELMRCDDAMSTVGTLIRPGFGLEFSRGSCSVQTTTKIGRIHSEFFLLQGKRAEARALAAGFYRAGQLYQHDYVRGGVQSLIGIALRGITIGTLQTQAANAVQTPEEATALWQDLELLNRHERPTEDARHFPVGDTRRRQFDDELRVRDQVASARFQLVRLTLAARWYQMSTGYPPSATTQLRPMYPAGLPVDPFTSLPLLLASDRTVVALYSTGPDLSDDRAEVLYDPTNGTISTGDIAVRLPVEREYPFHPQGTRAASAAELKRQFPRGLPLDPFADTKTRGYTISEMPGPVYVFSFGPNTDESRLSRHQYGFPQQTPAPTVPDVAFDPTNGITSRGDIFIRLPER